MASRRSPLLLAVAALLATAPLLAAPALAAPSPAPRSVVDGAVPLAFRARPRADGSGGRIAPPARVPVVVRFDRAVTPADLDALRSFGATSVERFSDAQGRRPMRPFGLLSRLALADLPASALPSVASLSGVRKVTLDGPLFPPPRPLDYTAALVQATDLGRTLGQDDLPIDGHGVTICDIDSGIDPFHPLFFRADGNGGKPYMDWVDENGDGAFTAGVDAVDLFGDGNPIVLRILNSVTTQIYDDEPLFGTDDPALDIGFDYLYADLNGSGVREFGPGAGFTEAQPTYGEPLFLVDDVDRNGVLDPGEKIVALGSSKIRAARTENKVYRRGENLIDIPVSPDVFHGTGAAGVLAAGTPGLTRLVGMAPGADLLSAANTDSTSDLKLGKFCRDEGAQVVLHEYAPWYSYHLDGSSPMEQFIDETSAEGISHVNPAGNLSGSDKAYKHTLTPGGTTDIPVTVPDGWSFEFFGMSLLWRDVTRDLQIALEDPKGDTLALPAPGDTLYQPWQDGLTAYSFREDSDRGTARMDFFLFNQSVTSHTIPPGEWKIHVTDPSDPAAAPVTLIGYVADERSGWGKGIYFPEHATEEHYIGYPGTADHGMPIAAFTGHGYWGAEPDYRAPYSGRGYRIDGEPILWISAPDDPITPGFREGTPALHAIYGGTSGASPHVAGGAALLLSQHPEWTGDDVKEAIRKGALVDDAVLSAGPVPNTDYGHGKLHLYESLYGKAPPGGSPPTLEIPALTVEQGDPAVFTLNASDPDEPKTALLLSVDRDYDGTFEETLVTPELTAPTSTLGDFFSKVRVTDSSGRSASALAILHVVPPGSLPDPDPDPDTEEDPLADRRIEAVGGGGCSTTGSPGAPAAPSALLTLLGFAAALRRRRRI